MEVQRGLNKIFIILFLLLATAPTLVSGQRTRVGFYASSCPQVESIVQTAIRKHFQSNPKVDLGLLRMHFHDCFVHGCDGSILIDGAGTEKTAPPNLLLRGYEVIDDAKNKLEQACPGVVSCADILALAARDSVVLACPETVSCADILALAARDSVMLACPETVSCADILALAARDSVMLACPETVSCVDILALTARDSVVPNNRPGWPVPTGRREGRVSSAADAANLPGFRDSVDVQKQKFSAKGLNTQDFVVLVGGHTIGTVACQFFQYRMYNFNSSVAVDPSINPAFLSQLQSLCPSDGDASKRVALDTGSETRFDRSFFANLQNGRGILESDQMLWTDASTRTVVEQFLGIKGFLGLSFNIEFARSMVKMSNIEVKTGTDGEIRKVCSAIS